MDVVGRAAELEVRVPVKGERKDGGIQQRAQQRCGAAALAGSDARVPQRGRGTVTPPPHPQPAVDREAELEVQSQRRCHQESGVGEAAWARSTVKSH